MKQITEQILLGSMCGDGHISVRNKFPVYQESHSIKQEEYLKWKANLLEDLDPRIYYSNKTCQKKLYKSIDLYIPVNADLLRFRNFFYKSRTGEKYISYKVLKMLKPLALAVWYMDDGNYDFRGNVVRLASCMNDIEVQKDIKCYFKNIFDLNCKINKSGKNYHLIVFTVDSSDKFLKMINKYIPDCMKYKLGHIYDGNVFKLNDFKNRRIKYAKSWYKLNYKQYKQYYLDNKEKINKRNNDYYLNNKNKILAQMKDYRLKNKDMISAKKRIYYLKNKIYINNHNMRNYYIKNKINKDV